MSRQINKNFNVNLFDCIRRLPLRRNAVTPEGIFGPILLHEEPSGVEIIEITSSNETETSPRDENDKIRPAWSDAKRSDGSIQELEENYETNKKLKEMRQVENNKMILTSAYASFDSNDRYNDLSDNFCVDYSADLIHDSDNKLNYNNPMNTFTIINKSFIDSDTSTEGEYSDVDIITSSDMMLGADSWSSSNNNNFYKERIITYDTDLDEQSRTILIYSYKNMHLLSEEDFAFNNPNTVITSSSTSYSTDSSGEVEERGANESCRSGISIPLTYVPRLDLSLLPTLSTVTEISENQQPSAKHSPVSTSKSIKKPNSWFISETAKTSCRKVFGKHEKASNVINWMALSPREPHRISKDKELGDTCLSSNLTISQICTENNTKVIETQNDGVKVKVDVQVHVDRNNKNSNKSVVKLKDAIVKSISEGENSNEIVKDADESSHKAAGDQLTKAVLATKIHLTPKPHEPIEITGLIERLENSNNRIRESSEEKETSVYDYVLDRSDSVLTDKNRNNEIDHVWMKNTAPFLKPSKRTKNNSLPESSVSYHLSLGSIIEDRQTWFIKLINLCKCCK